MRLDSSHKINHDLAGARMKVLLCCSQTDNAQRGFTLVELVMTIVILGIIAAVAAPRFFDNNVFQSRGFADQVQATLRYAQKEAVARRQFVCVALASNSITLTTGTTSACGTNLTVPSAPTATPNTISTPLGSGITLTYTSANFNFDALGRNTNVQQTITVSGVTNNIIVEAETGYVHSP